MWILLGRSACFDVLIPSHIFVISSTFSAESKKLGAYHFRWSVKNSQESENLEKMAWNWNTSHARFTQKHRIQLGASGSFLTSLRVCGAKENVQYRAGGHRWFHPFHRWNWKAKQTIVWSWYMKQRVSNPFVSFSCPSSVSYKTGLKAKSEQSKSVLDKLE